MERTLGSDRFAPRGEQTATRAQAVALAYEANSVAPRVIAKGEGLLAEAILQRAQESGIPVKVEPEVLALLMKLEVEDYIPPALYLAIAEILAWAYELDKKT